MGKEIEVEAVDARRYYQAFPFWSAATFLLAVILVFILAFCWGAPLFGLNFSTPAIPGIAAGPPPPPPIGACPRPTGVVGLQPGFNDQEREIRALRRLAFENDFFAQLELGRRYSGVRSSDKNIESPIEAAVWYAMALANPKGYAPTNRTVKGPFGGWQGPPPQRVGDCREWERHTAYHALDRLLGHMSTEEQAKVRNRVVYVLSTLGPTGYLTLGRIYDDLYGPFGEPIDDPQAMEAIGKLINSGPGQSACHAAATLFPRNDVDAYVYNYLAMQTGDVSAYVALRDFERSTPERVSFGGFAEAKAKRWVPPYEFYPPDAPLSGVPFSDESLPRSDDPFGAPYNYALSRMPELPFIHVGRAFCYLGVTDFVATTPAQLPPKAVQNMQALLGLPTDGILTNLVSLRAIQYAAVNGSAPTQLTLAVMYEEGVGVPADYARSFYWFTQAARQGSPEARFAMASFFALGVTGVADQDKAKAVVLRVSSALGGFQPSVSRLQAMAAQVSFHPQAPVG